MRLQWYLAFPQMVSRIGHPDKDVYQILEAIMLIVLQTFPDQAFWHMTAVAHSSKKLRAERCELIFKRARVSTNSKLHRKLIWRQSLNANTGISTVIMDGLALTDELLCLSNKATTDQDANRLSIAKCCPALRSVGRRIMLPIQSSMVGATPSDGQRLSAEHKLFTSRPVYVESKLIMESLRVYTLIHYRIRG